MTVNLTLIKENPHVLELTQVSKDTHGTPKYKTQKQKLRGQLKRERLQHARRGLCQLVFHIADS